MSSALLPGNPRKTVTEAGIQEGVTGGGHYDGMGFAVGTRLAVLTGAPSRHRGRRRERGGATVLVVVCGLPGTGKTTVAGVISDRVGGERLRTDVIRTELVLDPDYTPAETRRVYDELFARARSLVRQEGTVVLDGTFKSEADRRRARDLAVDLGVPFQLVHVECDPAVAKERIARRVDDESDADVAVYEAHRDAFEPIAMEHRSVDNSGDLDATVTQVEEVF